MSYQQKEKLNHYNYVNQQLPVFIRKAVETDSEQEEMDRMQCVRNGMKMMEIGDSKQN